MRIPYPAAAAGGARLGPEAEGAARAGARVPLPQNPPTAGPPFARLRETPTDQ